MENLYRNSMLNEEIKSYSKYRFSYDIYVYGILLYYITYTILQDFIISFLQFSIFFINLFCCRFYLVFMILTPFLFLLCGNKSVSSSFIIISFFYHCKSCFINCISSSILKQSNHQFTKIWPELPISTEFLRTYAKFPFHVQFWRLCNLRYSHSRTSSMYAISHYLFAKFFRHVV